MNISRITPILFRVLLVFLLLLPVVVTVRAQEGGGFQETFDDPTLPGWEYSPNVSVVDDVLRVEPDGFAFHGGQWSDLTLSLRARRTEAGFLTIRYSVSDTGAYNFGFGDKGMALLRDESGSGTELATAPIPTLAEQWVQVNITVIGGLHTISLDGQTVLTATDPQPLSPGGIVLLAGGSATGEFDDLSLVSSGTTSPQTETAATSVPTATSGSPLALTVSLDAAAIGQPISPYIYGMFIEHQGRCIYGGIWAEMIQDRKFFYPVNNYFPYGEDKGKSPWRATPNDTLVTMDSEYAYVGEHSPRITLDGQKPRGIMQDRLTLRQGKAYTGRIILSGSSSATVEVSLVWGPAPEDRQTITIGPLTQEYATTPLAFTAGADTDDARLEIVSQGEGDFTIGAVSLMPADNVQGMRADTLQLLQELGSTIYRWPGGTFVNTYNWRDAIGDPDQRPPRLNRAYWSEDVESNDFGPDEFMTLVEMVGAEAYIAVSATSAEDVQKAAEEVEYFNGASDTTMGQWRATNGHPEPYDVQFWGIGNENYIFAVLNEYVELHNQIAAAMRAVDPNISLIAVGGLGLGGQGKESGPDQPDWTEVMLTQSVDYMDLISEHFYNNSRDDIAQYAHSMAYGVRSFTDVHRQIRLRLPSLQGKDIRLALDEWNYSWENLPHIYGEAGPRYFFKNALGIAIGLHEMFRNSDLIFMANTHAVNVHGHIKTTQTDAAFEVTGLAWMLYRHHFGTLPITVSSDTDPLDVSAAWTDDRQYLTVAVVNPTPDSYTLTLDLQNAQLTGPGRWWRLASADPLAYNEPGQSPRVVVEEGSLPDVSLELSVAPFSIVLYELPAQ